jgi:hypothetical protein
MKEKNNIRLIDNRILPMCYLYLYILYFHSAFTRRLQFAFRLVITFLIGGFIGYATPLRNQLSQQSGIKTQSEVHLSHAFFFFQLGAIVRLLTQEPSKITKQKSLSKIILNSNSIGQEYFQQLKVC